MISQIDHSAIGPAFPDLANLDFAAPRPAAPDFPEVPGWGEDWWMQSHTVSPACQCAACCGVTGVREAQAENTTFVSDFTALLSGSSMSSDPGTGAFFTFSFPEQPPAYLSSIYGEEELASFEEFSESYKQVAREAVSAFTSISGLTGFEVSPGEGDVQFMIYDLALFEGFEGSAGFAYYPSSTPLGSDIFIDEGATGNSTNLYILLHELGHAFGLKHPFEGDVQLSDEFDNQSFTVMSYNFGQFDDTLGEFDTEAIINLYGDENADGNQVSSWSWDDATETLTQTGNDTGETISGVGTSDVINGEGGHDILNGRTGDDHLIGGLGDDQLNGGAGDDLLEGGEGNDRLDGDTGNDVLRGGAGNDRGLIDISSAQPAFTFDGGTGVDEIRINFRDAGGQRLTTGLAIETSTLNLTSVEDLVMFASNGDDRVTIDSDFDNAYVDGLQGDDVIIAGAGTGNLRGGTGNDIVVAGTGFSFMFGGSGTDRFVFTGSEVSNASVRDQLEDFETGVDTVELSGFAVGDIEINSGATGSFVTVRSSDGDVHIFVRTSISLSDFGLGLTGTQARDDLIGIDGSDRLSGEGGGDVLTGGLGDDIIDGGSSVDTAIVSGNRSGYTVTQTATGVFEVVGTDGKDTLTNVEFLQFDDETIRLRPGEGVSVDFGSSDPFVYAAAMENIRDFSGNDLGGDGAWLRIGSADVNGDGDIDQILVNDAIGRFATVGTAPDGLVYFDDHGWAGETRIAGIYIDPLVQSGDAELGGPFDSQTRFQKDLEIENINRVLDADDYDGDGIHEVYFALTDGTAYLRALMHDDGNIRYANYQSEQQLIDYLTANGYDESTYGDWFSGGQQAEEAASAIGPASHAVTSFGGMSALASVGQAGQMEAIEHQFLG